jgi:hypothetical protein
MQRPYVTPFAPTIKPVPGRTPTEQARLNYNPALTWLCGWITRRMTIKNWQTGGLVQSWLEPAAKDAEQCRHGRALVRGDGKILSKVDYRWEPCWMPATHRARVVKGHLQGVSTDGYLFVDRAEWEAVASDWDSRIAAD